jgi:CheY-like chemotaxis protein/anti-sigma regulatory factor (Ser/Thr protein kinase)
MSRVLVVEDDRTTRHLLGQVLTGGGYDVKLAEDGVAGLEALRTGTYDLMLLDVWMPRMNGLDVLASMRAEKLGPRTVVMTSDDTPETVLRAVREQAHQYVNKPIAPQQLLELVKEVLAAKLAPPVEVVSARPEWVELLVPCDLGTADRIQGFIKRLDADLPEDVREDIAYVFTEMLRNAVEWGGRLDPERKVRVACVRTKRMVLYRIHDPGPGFRLDELPHAAVSYPVEEMAESARVRQEKGIRPGGFGILIARSMVDELVYNEAHNEVLFVKYLD